MKKQPLLNAHWHLQNKLPKNATIDQRIAWHLEHLKNCSCRRDLPQSIKEAITQRNIPVPIT